MKATLFTLLPLVAMFIGAAIAVWRRPTALVASAIQHFAAGVVFAAAAGEILPDLKHRGFAWAVAIGGAIGVFAMLLIKHFGAKAKGPVGFAAVTGVDLLVDGLVLGIAFTTGQTVGILLTIALTLEVLFVGLSLAVELGKTIRAPGRTVMYTVALGLLLPLGALLALPVTKLPAQVVTGFFAFGLVALLYLVTEELLVEAHETEDRPWVAAMFFVGFLLLLLLEESVKAS